MTVKHRLACRWPYIITDVKSCDRIVQVHYASSSALQEVLDSIPLWLIQVEVISYMAFRYHQYVAFSDRSAIQNTSFLQNCKIFGKTVNAIPSVSPVISLSC